jgi:uncharacterized membrane protein
MASSKARPRTRPAARPAAPGVRATPTSPARSAGAARPATGQAAEDTAERQQPVAAEPEAERPAQPGPPLWLQLTSLALAVLGLGISAYETYAHYNGNKLAGCPTGGGGTFNCTAVITSPQSMVFGVLPVAILGLLFYVFVVAIMTPWAWRMQTLKVGPLRVSVGWLRLATMITGMGFVMYLIYAELYQIQDICEYCTVVHIVTFLLFSLTLFAAAVWGLGKPRTDG